MTGAVCPCLSLCSYDNIGLQRRGLHGKSIFFSKVEYQEYVGNRHSILLLNLPARELSYQVFQKKYLTGHVQGETTLFSRGIRLHNEQMQKILPLCCALDYEGYRNRAMSPNDEGYIGYRDEVRLSFCAVTDDCIPMIQLPMDYYYDEEHIWPSEKLYRHLVTNYLMNDQDAGQWVTEPNQ